MVTFQMASRFAWLPLMALCVTGASHADIEPTHSQAVYLTDLPERIAWARQGWGVLGIDESVRADATGPTVPLEIAGRRYTKGLGTHANSEIYFHLDGLYDSFEAEAGCQAGAGVGSIVFQVFGDGTKLYDSGLVKGGEPARQVSVKVAGIQLLKLAVADGGDGILCDMANWAEARLTETSDAARGQDTQVVDAAPFGCVTTSDPARLEGTQAGRLEEFPEKDLALECELLPGADGVWTVPVTNGQACIGINWTERHRIRTLGLEFATDSPVPPILGARVEGWTNTLEGTSGLSWGNDSPWQGKWAPLPGNIESQGHRWSWKLRQEKYDPLHQQGLRKIRWIFPQTAGVVRVSRLTAGTDARWTTARLLLQLAKPQPAQTGHVEMFLGHIISGPDGGPDRTAQSWDLNGPLELCVRCVQPQPWLVEDRTLMRIQLPSGCFAVAVDDAMTRGVYLSDFGCLITRKDANLSPADVTRQMAGRHTILERVEAAPDQTLEHALKALQIPALALSPAVIGLAGDNQKVEVTREGEIHFDSIPDNPAYPNSKPLWPGLIISCRFGIKPSFGTGEAAQLTRRLCEGWMPIPETILDNGGIRYHQLTYVAPADRDGSGGGAPYLNRRPLGVAEYVLENPGRQDAEATLALTFYADRSRNKSELADLKLLPDGMFVAYRGSQLLACLDTATVPTLTVSCQAGTVTLAGKVSPASKVRCCVYYPTWETNVEEAKTVAGLDGGELLEQTRVYWRNLLKPAMQVDIPDASLKNIMDASQAYCLLAARNEEDGARLAPWIALFGYGPLESEAQAIIRGMEYMGHADFARRSLDFYMQRYKPEGYMTHGYTLIGTGQHLWTLADYFNLTHDTAWMTHHAPEVKKACQWIVRQRAKTKRIDAHGNRVPEYGLMPPGVAADPPAYIYSFFNNGLYYAGLRKAADALARVGDPDAAALQRDAAEFRDDIMQAYHWMQGRAPAVPLSTGGWVPAAAGDLYGFEPGLYYGPGQTLVELGAQVLAAQEVLEPASKEIEWMMNYLEDNRFFVGGGGMEKNVYDTRDWFNVGGFSKAQPYYARTGEVYALQDRVKPFLRSYFNSIASCLNTETLTTWECPPLYYGIYGKTHEAGYFLFQTRLMFLMERGEDLWLAPFVPNYWLNDGLEVEIRNAPTFFGPCSFQIESHASTGLIEARIEPPTRHPPRELVLRLRHPQGKPMRQVTINGAAHQVFDAAKEIIRIKPQAGTIRVTAAY